MRERWWSAECRYAGMRSFMFGSVRATGVEEARGRLVLLWVQINPHPSPQEIVPIPGRLILVEDDE